MATRVGAVVGDAWLYSYIFWRSGAMSANRLHLSAAFMLAALVGFSGVVGCGGSESRSQSPATTKADAVDVTYYYLPG
jgi:hypothetical protein